MFLFTPGAQRALVAATTWAVDEVTPEALLHGLLADEESHASKQLTKIGVAPSDLHTQWPDMQPIARGRAEVVDPPALAGALEDGLHAALGQLGLHRRSVLVSTEHLLLAVILGGDVVGRWLVARGLEPANFAADIRQRQQDPQAADDIDWTSPLEIPEPESPSDERSPMIEHREPLVQESVRDHATGIARLLDAAANRAREALRVLEDYARFVCDDPRLTARLKAFRHELTATLAPLDRGLFLNSRDTPRDVGTQISTAAERRRADPHAVLTANCKRLQEALRSLEEFGKLVEPVAAQRLEQLRYQSYTIERELLVGAIARPQGDLPTRLAAARLYVLVDGCASTESFGKLVAALLAAKVDVIQLRDKRLDDRTLLARAVLLRKLTTGSRTLFVMNDRPDLAVLSGADGVHLGQEETPAVDARRLVGPRQLVGISTHRIEQARQAAADGADYIGVGPVFESTTKAFPGYPGLELCRAIAAEIDLPAFAIGGITIDRLPELLATGIERVAVSAAIVNATDPAAAARAFQAALSVR